MGKKSQSNLNFFSFLTSLNIQTLVVGETDKGRQMDRNEQKKKETSPVRKPLITVPTWVKSPYSCSHFGHKQLACSAGKWAHTCPQIKKICCQKTKNAREGRKTSCFLKLLLRDVSMSPDNLGARSRMGHANWENKKYQRGRRECNPIHRHKNLCKKPCKECLFLSFLGQPTP